MVLHLVTYCKSTLDHHLPLLLKVYRTHGVNFLDTIVTLCVVLYVVCQYFVCSVLVCVYMYACLSLCVYTDCICMRLCVCVRVHVICMLFLFVYPCVFVYVCVHMYACGVVYCSKYLCLYLGCDTVSQEDIDTPTRRSQMTKQLHHRESVDGKQEKTSPTTPNGSNNTNKNDSNEIMLKPDDVREEASLSSCDEPDSSPVISSLSSTNIQLGSDPLSRTQLEERKVRSAQSSPHMKRTDQPIQTRTNISKSLTALELQQQEHYQPSKVVRYGAYLTLEDHNRLQRFLEEFVTRGLLPHLEQLTRTMNERVSLIV